MNKIKCERYFIFLFETKAITVIIIGISDFKQPAANATPD